MLVTGAILILIIILLSLLANLTFAKPVAKPNIGPFVFRNATCIGFDFTPCYRVVTIHFNNSTTFDIGQVAAVCDYQKMVQRFSASGKNLREYSHFQAMK